MNILIAPNAFKNSLDATTAAAAIEKGLQQSRLTCHTECFPIADGGDGTGELIIKKCKGAIIEIVVNDPLGREIKATYGVIDAGKTAVIEMASASGLRLLNSAELNPMIATSYGTGQMIKHALDNGVNKLILAMGGSATVDGGCGILNALGINFIDADGNELVSNPKNLAAMSRVDIANLHKRLSGCQIMVLCDVDNRLLGQQGAAAVFGPQKGATADDVQKLDAFLTRFNNITLQQTGINMAELKYGGAAGGSTAGIYAWLNAKLVNGIDHFLKLTGFEQSLQKADVIITGEGSIDSQTLQGKGPFGVAQIAKQHGKPVIGIAGRIPLLADAALHEYFDVLLAIGNEPADLFTAMKFTEDNLVRMGMEIGNLLGM